MIKIFDSYQSDTTAGQSRKTNLFYGLFLRFFLVAYLLLFLSLAPIAWIESAHHDNTRYFRVTNASEFKSRCGNDSQYRWLQLIGRPVTAIIECQVFKYTRSLNDLGVMRIVVIAILSIATAILGLLLTRFGFDQLSAGLTAIAVFTLPGAQNTAFMTNFANALAPVISLGAYFFLLPVIQLNMMSNSWAFRMAICIALLLFAMLIYPALVFVYFWGTLVTILYSISNHEVSWFKTTIRDIAIFFAASLLYLMVSKMFIPHKHRAGLSLIPEQFQPDFSLVSVAHKIPILFTEIFQDASALWFKSQGLVSALILGVLAFCALYLFFGFRKKSDIKEKLSLSNRIQPKITCVFLILVCTFAPLILTKSTHFHQRVLFPAMGAVVIVVISLVPIFLWRIFDWRIDIKLRARQLISVLAATTGLILASYTTALNVWNTNIEMEFVRHELAKTDALPRRIHLIRAMDNNIGFNGLKSFSDEFNRKTTDFKQDIVDFIRIALVGSSSDKDVSLIFCDFRTTDCELVVPKNSTILSISDYGEEVCQSDNMALVDLNVLVRSTRTGSPKLIDRDYLPLCSSGKFLVFTRSDSTSHGISKAFDNSMAPDDFWETSIVEPALLNLNYRIPTILVGYELSAGETGERMPISWKVLASTDSRTWVVIDIQNDIKGWNQNEKRTFDIKSAQPYSYYQFVFEKSSHPKIMRIYEIKLIESSNERTQLDCAPPTGDFSPRFEGSATGGFGVRNPHLVFLRG